jgi:hypothetical protein
VNLGLLILKPWIKGAVLAENGAIWFHEVEIRKSDQLTLGQEADKLTNHKPKEILTCRDWLFFWANCASCLQTADPRSQHLTSTCLRMLCKQEPLCGEGKTDAVCLTMLEGACHPHRPQWCGVIDAFLNL